MCREESWVDMYREERGVLGDFVERRTGNVYVCLWRGRGVMHRVSW